MTELSLERFAEALAEVEKVRDLRRVLAASKISAEEWEAARRRWGEGMLSSAPLRARFVSCYERARSPNIEAAGGGTRASEAFLTAPASPGPGSPSGADTGARDRQLPTYLREIAAPGEKEGDVDTTQFMPVLVLGPALPFEGSTSPAKLAELKRDAAGPGPHTPPDAGEAPEETLEIRSPLLQASAGTGSFRDAISPIAVPVLTIEQYAQLVAKLRVLGEAHEPTWREFQISSPAVKSALVARFDAYFAKEPQAKAELENRVERLVGKARTVTVRLAKK